MTDSQDFDINPRTNEPLWHPNDSDRAWHFVWFIELQKLNHLNIPAFETFDFGVCPQTVVFHVLFVSGSVWINSAGDCHHTFTSDTEGRTMSAVTAASFLMKSLSSRFYHQTLLGYITSQIHGLREQRKNECVWYKRQCVCVYESMRVLVYVVFLPSCGHGLRAWEGKQLITKAEREGQNVNGCVWEFTILPFFPYWF